MQYRGYTYDRLDGSVRAEERFAAVRSFSAAAASSGGGTPPSGGPFVFLLTTRAGGVGLNLVAADTVSSLKLLCCSWSYVSGFTEAITL